MVELHLIAKGHVQGVFFRATSQDLANELGLSGWVKNLSNGDVELVAQGEKAELQLLLDRLKDTFDAEFHATYREPKERFTGFMIRRA